MAARPRLPLETHRFIRRGHTVLHLSAQDLALMFEISPQRVHQILADMERAKVDGRWVIRKRGRNEDRRFRDDQ